MHGDDRSPKQSRIDRCVAEPYRTSDGCEDEDVRLFFHSLVDR